MADHRIDRALERYGIVLNRADIDDMERAILAGRSIPVRRHPSGGVVHLVKHGALPMIAVWNLGKDDGHPGIATFLPADALVAGVSRARNQARRREGLKRKPKLHGWGRREG